MPKYVMPEVKEDKSTNESCCAEPDNYQRILYIPVNKEIIDALAIDQEVEVKLVGKIVGLEAREGSDYSSHEIKIEIKSVETYEAGEENEFSELAKDDD